MAKHDLCLVTGIPPTALLIKKFISVLQPLASNMVILTGRFNEELPIDENIRVAQVGCYKVQKGLPFILGVLFLQLKYGYHLLKHIKNFKTVIFFLGGSSFLLPILISRFFRKKTVFVVTHSTSQVARGIYTSSKVAVLTCILEHLNYSFCHRLIVYSPNLIQSLGLGKYREKILTAYEHFVDFNLFYKRRDLDERGYAVGFVGRLSREKGILNLIPAMKAIPIDTSLIICGDGELRTDVENLIKTNGLSGRVTMAGWVSQDKLPEFLNNMRVLVIPSYTEGLVNVMCESMACGTPVVATPVGAVPDFICDGETGFLMKSNKPEDIAEGIVRALSYPALDKISKNIQAFVKDHFSKEKAIIRYEKVLDIVS